VVVIASVVRRFILLSFDCVKNSKARCRRDVQACERQRHPRYAPSRFQKVFVPADDNSAANWRQRRHRYVWAAL